jgi:hypothetical protein
MMLDRSRLASHLQAFPKQTIPVASLRPAAVLIPLYQRKDRDYLLFTERTAHLEHHAGEISFPGGGYDHGDKDLITTALRETEEKSSGVWMISIRYTAITSCPLSALSHFPTTCGTILLKLPAPSRPRWIIFETHQLIVSKTGNTSAGHIR